MQRLGLMSSSGMADHYYASNGPQNSTHRRLPSRLAKFNRPGGQSNYDSGLEFEDLINDTKFQAWSPSRDHDISRVSATIKRPSHAIVVENKFDVSTEDTRGPRYR